MNPLNLFSQNHHAGINLLPKEGEVYYFGALFDQLEADRFFAALMTEVQLEHDVVKMFGKTIITKRKSAWYADNQLSYTYSGVKKMALSWTRTLLELKEIVQGITKETYNSCLLNYYHNGSEAMSWHSDDEPDLKPNGSIASLSLGAARRFEFKHKHTKETIRLILENGSLLEMKGLTQSYWFHRLPPDAKISAPRLNLTFRTIVQN